MGDARLLNRQPLGDIFLKKQFTLIMASCLLYSLTLSIPLRNSNLNEHKIKLDRYALLAD